MRIGIDAHAIGTQVGGNETFIKQLLCGLSRVAPETDIIALVNAGLEAAPGIAEGFKAYPIWAKSSWTRVPFALPQLARKLKLDLLHVQYNAPPYCRCPYIVTLHDMVWRRFPETLPWVDRVRLNLMAPGTIKKARRVFCVTEAMKREATEIYNVPAEKIDVVGNAVAAIYRPITDPSELAAVRGKYNLPSEFILYVGALQPRKNLVRLAKAFARLKDRGISHRLVFTGQRTHYGPIAKEIDALDLGDRLMFTGYVDTMDLPRLMSAASAFAYISLYEGFGIPVVEALSCGTPTLISNDPALNEIAGGLALACDPYSLDAIEEGLVRVLSDSEMRERVRREGPGRAEYYCCERMGRAAIEGYRKALL